MKIISLDKNYIENKSFISGEFIFALWFWKNVFMLPFIKIYGFNSFVLLSIFTLLLFFATIIKKIRVPKIFLFIIIFWLIITIKFILNFSEIYFTIWYNFTISSVLGLYFFGQLKDIELFLKYVSLLGIIVFFISFRDPFNGYILYKNYMGFGFAFSLPATIFFRIARKYLNKKYFFIFEIYTTFLLVTCSNRSVLLSLIFFYLLEILFLEKNSKFKKFLKLSSILCLGIFIFLSLDPIVEYLYNLSIENNLDVRLLKKLYYNQGSSFSNLNGLTSGRMILWVNAINIIKENPIFGKGIGIFESTYGNYSHNLILDLLMQFGILGFIFFIVIIVKSFFNIINYGYYEKIFGIILLVLWFPILLFSQTIYSNNYLCLFLAFGLYNLKKYKIKL